MGVNVSLSEHREIPNRTLTNNPVATVVQKTALGHVFIRVHHFRLHRSALFASARYNSRHALRRAIVPSERAIELLAQDTQHTYMTNGGEQGTERIHNDTLRSFHSSPTTVKMIKQRRTGQAGHAACTGEITHTKLQFENMKEELRIRSSRWENNAKYRDVNLPDGKKQSHSL